MPVISGSDYMGNYYKWGNLGHKYYYIRDKRSKSLAYNQALRQGRAIFVRKNKY